MTYVLGWTPPIFEDKPMLYRFESYCRHLAREVGHFDQQQWMIVIALVVVVGVFLLRGHRFRSY